MTLYTQHDLPASLKTQLAMYESTIADAEQKLAEARLATKEMLDEFHGLIGKTVRVHYVNGSRTAFKVDLVDYDRGSGRVSRLTGPRVKKDGSLSLIRGYAYPRSETLEIVNAGA